MCVLYASKTFKTKKMKTKLPLHGYQMTRLQIKLEPNEGFMLTIEKSEYQKLNYLPEYWEFSCDYNSQMVRSK